MLLIQLQRKLAYILEINWQYPYVAIVTSYMLYWETQAHFQITCQQTGIQSSNRRTFPPARSHTLANLTPHTSCSTHNPRLWVISCLIKTKKIPRCLPVGRSALVPVCDLNNCRLCSELRAVNMSWWLSWSHLPGETAASCQNPAAGFSCYFYSPGQTRS